MEQLIKEYGKWVTAIVRNTLGDLGTREEIEECVNDVFFEYSRKWENSGWDRQDPKGYLALLAKRRATDRYRILAKQAVRIVGVEELERYPDPSRKQDPEEQVIRGEERQRLAQELDNLGELDREILLRRYYLEQPVNEIAGQLQMKENTVSVRIRRALKRLAIVLAVVLLLFLLARPEVAAEAVKRLFAFLPGMGVVETEEEVYTLEEVVKRESEEFVMEITNARLTGDELVVYLVVTPQEQQGKETWEGFSGTKDPDTEQEIWLEWGDQRLEPDNMSGALSEVYHYELIFTIPEPVSRESLSAVLHYGEGASCDFRLVGAERLAALEEVGTAECHNDIWILASAEQTEEGLLVDLYALNQSEERLMSLGQDRGGLYAYGQESSGSASSYPIISEPREEEYPEYYLRIGEQEYRDYEYLPRFGGYPSLLFRGMTLSEDQEAVLVIPYLRTQTTETRNIRLPVPEQGETVEVGKELAFEGGSLYISRVTRNSEYWDDTLKIELQVSGDENKELMDLDLGLHRGFADELFGDWGYAIVYSRERTEEGDITAIYWRINEEEINTGKLWVDLKNPVYRLTEEYELRLQTEKPE